MLTLNKQIAEAKEKIGELEIDKNKREATLREKDKQLASVTKQAAQDAEERKRELGKRES